MIGVSPMVFSARWLKMPSMDEKVCTKCGERKLLAAFYKRPAMRDGHQSWCKTCVIARAGERWREKNPVVPFAKPYERTCTRCKIRKVLADFHQNQYQCRPCKTEMAREARAADPLFSVKAHLWNKYKMRVAEYDSLLESQGGGCALCGAKAGVQRLHVDHDHRCCAGKRTCGKCVRGIVCYPCNTKLSILDTDSPYALRVRAYLKVEVIRLE